MLSPDQLLEQARHGDLRPEINPHAPVNWPGDAVDPAVVVPILLNRFFELSRPIADAAHEPGLAMQLGAHDRFVYLVEALRRFGYTRIDETLLMFLDEFCQLEQRSYDDLYLWSIVELSRMNIDYVGRFWPLALTLDLCFRAEPWDRPADVDVPDAPYRLTELVMYYYVHYTQEREVLDDEHPEPGTVASRRRYPGLLSCIRTILDGLSDQQAGFLLATLRDLYRPGNHPDFGDAYGWLTRNKRNSPGEPGFNG